MRRIILLLGFLLASPAVHAKETADKSGKQMGDKQMAGMSVVGNDDAPKALVIVPWKSSDLGARLDVSQGLDDGRQPVDRDVFKRELDYYQIRSSQIRSNQED
jgi:hypothetical protein